MTYKEAMTYIRNTAAFGTKLGLDNIRALMSLLGDPQEKLKIIHIAGTNGKGSVAAYLLSVLRHAGYRVGSYTSPELFRFSERIKTGDEEISEDDIALYATKVRAAADHMKENNMGDPSEFELVLAMAFCFFLDRNVDIVILETGLGGRLDATNVISHSVLSVITKISFDHMQYLGDTLPKIAAEKAASSLFISEGQTSSFRSFEVTPESPRYVISLSASPVFTSSQNVSQRVLAASVCFLFPHALIESIMDNARRVDVKALIFLFIKYLFYI